VLERAEPVGRHPVHVRYDGGETVGAAAPLEREADTGRRLAVAAAYLLAFGAVVAGVVVATQLDSYGTAAALMAALVAVRADVVDRVDKEPPRARGVPPRIAAALRENEGA